MVALLRAPKMSRRLSITAAILVITLVSGLAMALPTASAQSTVNVKIPGGAGIGPVAAPGYSPDSITVVIGMNNTVTWTNDDSTGHTVTSSSVPTGATTFDSGLFPTGFDLLADVHCPGHVPILLQHPQLDDRHGRSEGRGYLDPRIPCRLSGSDSLRGHSCCCGGSHSHETKSVKPTSSPGS